ncbi:unnamed protein product [Phaedon cochleariae]|uniref:Arrestin C-terminal-like domain-containing protein n=1 Tax=Phaedon cochleariae TaxID=80249 RepID=A0A9N9SEP9_PHACE|nr:unnamed protein product [Phaedon cochleariae]
MAQCKVWLDNYAGQYYPGSQIQGKVILNFNSQTTLRSVKIRLACREHTEWMGEESYLDPLTNERRDRQVLLQGDNDAFATELILYGGQTGTTALSAGQHIYPFNVTLPFDIPGTFNCEHGSVSYLLKAVVDRPMAFDYEDEIIFLVTALVDLNMLQKPELLESTSYSDDKTLCCWCCAEGPISIDVELPKRTQIPGETVNITARLTNMSNTNIEGVELKLKQKITCKVLYPSPDENLIENILISIDEVGLGAHGEHTYIFPVMLPMNVMIPNFTKCNLFSVDYKYKIVAKLPGVHSNLEIDMYPELGNIPIGQISGQPGGYPTAAAYPPSGEKGYQPHLAGPQGDSNPPYPQQGPPAGFVPPPGAVSVYPPAVPSAPPLNGDEQGFNSQLPPPSYDSLLSKK